MVLLKFLSSCYSVIRKDRNKHGGGVIILIDTNIDATEITNINVNIEHAWYSFNVEDDSYLLDVIYIYRPITMKLTLVMSPKLFLKCA